MPDLSTVPIAAWQTFAVTIDQLIAARIAGLDPREDDPWWRALHDATVALIQAHQTGEIARLTEEVRTLKAVLADTVDLLAAKG